MQQPDHGPWPVAVPELLTPRLRLRALKAEDAPALLEVLGDEQVTRFHSMPTLASLAEARDALDRVEQRFRAGEMIRWAIEVRPDRRLVGTVGLLHVVAEHRRGELGFREEGVLRHSLYLKGRFHDVRWFGLLQPDADQRPP